MGVTIATTRVALNTVTGTQDFTTTDCGGLTPKAAMLYLTKATADGTVTSDIKISIGATDGTRQWCLGGQVQDAQATTATDRFIDDDHCVVSLDTTGLIEGSALFDSWLTNGIRLNIDDAFPAAYLLTIVFFCGTDVSAYASSADLGNTTDLETNITAVGFQPDVVFAGTILTSTADVLPTEARWIFGVAQEAGGVVTQRSFGVYNRDAQATVNNIQRLSTQYGIMSYNTGGTPVWGGEFANFDSQGFSVFTRVAGANGVDIVYLALDFNGAADVWLGTVATPTSTGSASVTSPGFQPQFVMMGLTMNPAVNTGYTTDDANAWGIGVMTATAQYCNAMWDDDAAADSNAECISDNQPINIKNGIDGTGLVAAFTSFDSTGWTVNYSDVEAAAKQMWALAIEAVASGTLYTQSVSGGITPAGALARQTNKPLAGSIATIAGALIKQTSKSFAGAVSTIAGTLVKQTSRSLAGAVSSIAGVLSRVVQKPLSGALEPAGALLKQTNKSLGGSVSSIAGVLGRVVQRSLSGALVPTGDLVKQTGKMLAGAVSTIEGALVTIRLLVIELSGGITPAGSTTKQTHKALSGENAPSGTIAKQTNRLLAGALATIAGTLNRLTGKSFSGAATPSGTVTKSTSKQLASSLSSSGGISRAIGKVLSGTLSGGGTLSRLTTKTLSGLMSIAGNLTSTLISSGGLGRALKKIFRTEHRRTHGTETRRSDETEARRNHEL